MKTKFLAIILLILVNVSAISSASRSNMYQDSRNENPKEIIQKFEAGFLNFSVRLAKVLKRLKPMMDEKTFNSLKEPLIIFIYNLKKNKHKYHKDYLASLRQTNSSLSDEIFKDNKFFYYDILPVNIRKYGLMAFKMSKRVMYLNPSYNPSSIMDNLIAFHEMVHALQDSILRLKLAKMGDRGKKALKRYIMLLNKNLRDPDIEPVAYAMEIEVLNLLFKDKIRKIVKSGKRIPISDLARILRADTKIKLNSLRYLLKYSVYYFGHDCKIFSYSLAYRNAIISDHIKIGYKFYRSENRFIKEFQNRTNSGSTQTNRSGENSRRGLGGVDIN